MGNPIVLSKASIGKTVQVAKRVNATWSMTTTAFIFDPTVAGLDPYHQPTVFDEVTLNGFSMTVVPVGPTPPIFIIVATRKSGGTEVQ
jgi:hypothetical protein